MANYGWTSPIVDKTTSLLFDDFSSPIVTRNIEEEMRKLEAQDLQQEASKLSLQEAKRSLSQKEAKRKAFEDFFNQNPGIASDPTRSRELLDIYESVQLKYGEPEEVAEITKLKLAERKELSAEKKQSGEERQRLAKDNQDLAFKLAEYDPELASQLANKIGIPLSSKAIKESQSRKKDAGLTSYQEMMFDRYEEQDKQKSEERKEASQAKKDKLLVNLLMNRAKLTEQANGIMPISEPQKAALASAIRTIDSQIAELAGGSITDVGMPTADDIVKMKPPAHIVANKPIGAQLLYNKKTGQWGFQKQPKQIIRGE